jgi:hypothetical protein
MNIYGVLNSEGVHIDTSKTLQGAKRHATINGYNTITVRYNCGYITEQILYKCKLTNKWRAINQVI